MSFKSFKGSLLLDGGNLVGSFFHRTVVLICSHDAEGAFGLILNRPTDTKAGEAVVANIPDWIKGQNLFIGGPVQPQVLSYLHSDSFVPDANVMANVALGHSLDELLELSEAYSPTRKLKLFAGYAGWDAGQLEREMARKDWLVHPASMELIFSDDPKDLWKCIIQDKDPMTRLLADAPEDLSWN